MKFNTGSKLLSLGLLVYLALASGCSHDNPLPKTPYEKADTGNGGIMYDKFWSTEAGFDQTDPNIDNFNTNADFFRCKQCHAWDGLGTAGSYITRGATSTRPHVAALNLYEAAQQMTSDELFAAMKETTGRRDISVDLSSYDPVSNKAEGDKMPDLNQILTDKQIWDLVKFLKEGMFDVSQLYDGQYQGAYPTGIASYSNLGLDGDAATGNAYYTDKCAACHGEQGLTIDLNGKGVGGFARSKPYELQHKAKYGVLGSAMVGDFEVSQNAMKDLYKALADETDFPTDIPETVSYSGQMQPFFTSKCMPCHNAGSTPPNLSSPDSYTALITGSNGSGVAWVNTANPPASALYVSIFSGSMSGKASATEIDMVLRWIEQGALDN